MKFDFSEQQLAFGESARRVFRETFPQQAEGPAAGEPPPAARCALAEAGLLGIVAPEAAGGLELALGDALPVVMEAAAACAPFPVAESNLAARLMAAIDPALAAPIVEGRDLAAFSDLSGLMVERRRDGNLAVSGTLGTVAWGDIAQWLIGTANDPAGGLRLLAVDLEAAGRQHLDSHDRSVTMASLSLEAAPAIVLGGSTPAEVHAWQAVLSAADLYGLSRTCFEQSTEYAKTREQFGEPIGRFQAVKHMLADCAVWVESMLITVQYAAWALDQRMWDGELAALSARTYCADAARKVCEEAIQLHGGIGFTWDFGLHFHLRRAVRLATTPATTIHCRHHLSRLILDRVAGGESLHH